MLATINGGTMEYAIIKEKRLEYKISQTKIAEATGFSKAMISSWELGKTIPSRDDFQIVSNALLTLINNINNGLDDVRKKRITKSNAVKKDLPKAINDADEYNKSLKNLSKVPCAYRDSLSNLYHRAMYEKTKDAPKAIALFSGCGGLSLGFAAAGFNLVGHVEIKDSANKIYNANFSNSKLLGTDICDITESQIKDWKKEFGDIDVVIGGPPCQGFSLAGKRDPDDLRNQLFKYYSNIVSLVHPKAFVFENVRLLTSMKTTDGKLFIDCIFDSFSKAGYHLAKKELNMAEYGVPQSRERVVIVGVRNDIDVNFSFPIATHQANSDTYSLSLFETPSLISFRDATCDLIHLESGEVSDDPLHWSIVHPEHVIRWLKDVPEGCSAHDNENPDLRPPSGFNTTYKRIKWDEPCSTITTNFSMISGCRNVHPTATRSLTIREAARAQSFPDEFVFLGKWGDVRKAIGNAVPPIFAEIIADEIKNQILSK